MHIFIFHRDLRLTDNTTLIHQMKQIQEGVVPIFIFPPEQIDKKKNKYFSDNSVQFMIECLHELSDNIKDKNGKIYFFKGDTIKVLNEINKYTPISSIGFNIDYTPYARSRDNEINFFCKENNIKCYQKEDYALYDIIDGSTLKQNGEPYLVFTPFYKFCMNNLDVRPIDKFTKFKFKKININNKYLIDEKEIDIFYDTNNNILVKGGRNNGLKILSKMDNFKDYEKCKINKKFVIIIKNYLFFNKKKLKKK
jgi:deoxyribodipyrimidine photo-lyase